MKTIIVDSERVGYDPITDVLFVSFGPYDLTCLDHEDELADGVYLQYSWPGGELAGMEVWKFSRRYGSLPVTLLLHGDEDLEIVIPKPDYALA